MPRDAGVESASHSPVFSLKEITSLTEAGENSPKNPAATPFAADSSTTSAPCQAFNTS